jgi:hypothetical protein
MNKEEKKCCFCLSLTNENEKPYLRLIRSAFPSQIHISSRNTDVAVFHNFSSEKDACPFLPHLSLQSLTRQDRLGESHLTT